MPTAYPPILRPYLDRFLAQVPGWIFLLCGVALVAAIVLGRGRLENARLIWQRDLLQAQAQRLIERRDAYKTLAVALDEGDPVLLERLAFDYLHLQPRDRLLLDGQTRPTAALDRRTPAAATSPVRTDTAAAPDRRDGELRIDRSIEASLHRPLPREGIEFQTFTPDGSLLARLARGLSAPGLVIVGGMFIVAGLMWQPSSPGDRTTSPIA